MYLCLGRTVCRSRVPSSTTGSLGVYRYNQSSEEWKEHISPDVSLQTVIPDLRIMTEYWLASNQFGFSEAAIAPFGYSLNGDNNIKTISNVRAGLAFHHPLGDKLSLEVGLAYHNTNGMDFRFEEERTKVDAFSQSITEGHCRLVWLRESKFGCTS